MIKRSIKKEQGRREGESEAMKTNASFSGQYLEALVKYIW